MNEIMLLLDILKDKYPNKIPIGRDYDLDSFRMKQGEQNVIRTVEHYLSKLQHEASKKNKQ